MSDAAIASWNTHGAGPAPALGPEDKIRVNFREYSWFFDLSQDAWRRGNIQAACAYASMAARVAAHRHCGFFASPRLERMLISIGRDIKDETTYRRPAAPKQPKRVLHVCTEVVDVGGHSKMLARWMREDSSREHSLALTQHDRDVPAYIAEAVKNAGGAIHRLDLKPRDYAARALDLRNVARGYDLIVLHVYSEDPIPMLAFARLDTVPPVTFLNHADHMFWFGPSISDVVINLRDAAENLSINRRGVPVERNAMAPTLVSKTVRKRTPQQAKQELGLDPNTILLLSAARAAKYRTIDGVTFADTHVPALIDNPNARLFVLGVGDAPDWAPAIKATGGRIVPLAPVPDPSLYYEAADIYVDSYPFVSSTSMMEAAGLALPMVSRFYAPDAAEIIGINHPGLKAASLFASNDEQYVEILRRLIAEPDFRRERGEIADRAVADLHQVPGWTRFWQASIDKALTLPPLDGAKVFEGAADETPSFGEPDIRMNALFGLEYATVLMLRNNLRYLPTGERLARWNEIRKSGGFVRGLDAARHLLPDSILKALGR